MATRRRVDTHTHIVPSLYREWLAGKGISAGGLPVPAWSADDHVAMMDRHDIETAIMSVSTPGAHLGDDGEARTIAREVNEYAAEVVATHPERFGFFATLTLPDVEGSLEEAAYALDELHADGVVLLANVGGVYLGDPSFDLLFDELNRRAATIFVHPSALVGVAPAAGLPPYIVDFLLDTTRAAIRLARSGTLDRCPDLKIILSHGGGFLPYAAARIGGAASPRREAADGIRQLQRFYFDTALSSSPYALPSLLAFAQPEHVTFGSDWPYAPEQHAAHFITMLEEYGLDSARAASLERGAAEQLFPRLNR